MIVYYPVPELKLLYHFLQWTRLFSKTNFTPYSDLFHSYLCHT